MKQDNQELEIMLDGFSQTLSEIKGELVKLNSNTNNAESALNSDLLNKIVNTIDQAKKSVDLQGLEDYSAVIIATWRNLQDEANKDFSQFLDEKIVELEQIVKEPSTVNNRYTIDFASSKTVIFVVIASLALFGSLFGNYNQYENNKILIDNDLKYRFVKAANQADSLKILELENVFHYDRNEKSIAILRERVEKYETVVKKRAEELERARLKEEEAEKLTREVEVLRKK